MADIPIQITNATGIVHVQISDPFTIGVFIATAALAGFTMWLAIVSRNAAAEANKSTRASLAEVKNSNAEQKAFNDLLRRDIVSRLRPNIVLSNTSTEPEAQVNIASEAGSTVKKLSYHPNFKNDGLVEASAIKIHHKVMDKVVNLEEILKQENEIKQNVIEIEGSVFQESRTVHEIIQWEAKPSNVSVVVWFTYGYLGNQSDEIIYDLQFFGYGGSAVRVIPYRSLDIATGRPERIKRTDTGSESLTSKQQDEQTRKATYDQIMIGAQITIGVTLMAIGLSIFLVQVHEPSLIFKAVFIGAFAAYVIAGLVLLVRWFEKAKER